jgi:hypothetical protein
MKEAVGTSLVIIAGYLLLVSLAKLRTSDWQFCLPFQHLLCWNIHWDPFIKK